MLLVSKRLLSCLRQNQMVILANYHIESPLCQKQKDNVLQVEFSHTAASCEAAFVLRTSPLARATLIRRATLSPAPIDQQVGAVKQGRTLISRG
jgi:hypothetical protein